MYRLSIMDRRSLIRFSRIIKPLHPERGAKLKLLIQSYKTSTWISSKDILPKILSFLQEGEKQKIDICNHLNITHSKARLCLDIAKSQNLVSMKEIQSTFPPLFYYTLTPKGLDYIKDNSNDLS